MGYQAWTRHLQEHPRLLLRLFHRPNNLHLSGLFCDKECEWCTVLLNFQIECSKYIASANLIPLHSGKLLILKTAIDVSESVKNNPKKLLQSGGDMYNLDLRQYFRAACSNHQGFPSQRASTREHISRKRFSCHAVIIRNYLWHSLVKTYLPLVPHIWVSESGQHWFR